MSARLARVAILALLTAVCGCHEPRTFTVEMHAYNNVPPLAGNAAGTASFTVDGATVTYSLSVTSMSSFVEASHIHSGRADENGPVRVALFVGPTTEIPEGLLISGSFTSADVKGITFRELLSQMRTGVAYVNVHTQLNPPGESRGQVREQL